MAERISCRSLEEERRSSVGLIRNSKKKVKELVSQDLKAEGISCLSLEEERRSSVGLIRNSKTKVNGPVSQDLNTEGISCLSLEEERRSSVGLIRNSKTKVKERACFTRFKGRRHLMSQFREGKEEQCRINQEF